MDWDKLGLSYLPRNGASSTDFVNYMVQKTKLSTSKVWARSPAHESDASSIVESYTHSTNDPYNAQNTFKWKQRLRVAEMNPKKATGCSKVTFLMVGSFHSRFHWYWVCMVLWMFWFACICYPFIASCSFSMAWERDFSKVTFISVSYNFVEHYL